MPDDDIDLVEDLEREEYDDDDEEEEEEYDDDQPVRKKTRLNPFIDVEAAVEDEDEDDDIEEDDEPDGPIVDEEGFDEEANKDYLSDRIHREVERNRRRMEDEDAEKVAEALNERYRTAYIAGAYRGDTEHIPQQMLMPDIRDPKLYLLKCIPGKERDIVWNIMRKYMDFMTTTTPLSITSAFAKDNLKGYFYIEADKEAHVRAAIDGLRGVYGSKISMVPPNEMVPSLTIKTTHKEFEPGSWVRVRVGKYKGDLARIEAVEGPESLYLRLVPRVDPPKEKEPAKSKEDKKTGDKKDDAKRKKPIAARGPQKLFIINDVDRRTVSRIDNGNYVVGRDTFSQDGFLLRSFRVQQLDTDNINPTLDEIAMFNVKDYSKELKSLPDYLNTVADFSVGETVVVKNGGYKARVVSIERDSVRLQPLNESGTSILLNPADISKHFSPGDHVKVVNGIHKDETGLIVNVKDQIVNILSDLNLNQFEVLMKDLKLASETRTTASLSGGKYDIHDLVDLPSGDVAIIVGIDKDWVTVMNQWGAVSGVKPAQISVKRTSKNAVTNDSKGNPIRSADQIEIVDRSQQSGKRAAVLHVFRSLLFCHSRELPEHGGIFVTKASSTISTKHGSMNGGGFGGQPFGAQPAANRGGTNGPPAAPFFAVPRARKNAFVDRTVRIVRGAYKGYMATIMDVNPPKVRLKLHTNNKIVNCNVKEVQNPDDTSKTLGDDTPCNTGSSSTRLTPSYGAPSTPFDPFGGRTPAYGGSRTPAYGGRTPGYNPGESGRTPAWQPGSRTPGYVDGGKTPAWDAGSNTPGYRDGGEGSRTPAPAWDAGSTPRVYDEDQGHRTGGASTYVGGTDRASESRFEAQLAGMVSQNTESPWTGASASPYPSGNPYTPHTAGNYPSINSVPGTALSPLPNPDTPSQIPASPYTHATPAGIPVTPGPVGSVDAETAREVNWASENLEVVFDSSNTRSFANGQYGDQRAVIISTEMSNCTVRLLETNEVINNIPVEFLHPVRPERKDAVKILASNDGDVVGSIGQLLSIDAADGVVKTRDGQMKIIPIRDLAKYVS
ncbi:hypothetical protein SeLEV6574_g04831 [Synchytrium endobioticum]|nr:hypothetical protein SeLEV6574_g04831 [Synchytrium endobioticum]